MVKISNGLTAAAGMKIASIARCSYAAMRA